MQKSVGTPQQKKLQELLRKIREEAGLSQLELATKLQTTQSTVSNIERGEKMLDLLELCQVVDAIGIPLAEFIARFETEIGRV